MKLRLKHQQLVNLMAESPLSQNHWAIRIGISRGHWSEIVNGKHPYISARTRVRILEAFNVPVEKLFELETGPAPWADGDFRRAVADRYLIDSELGQGGMGAVYLARDVRHGRSVAIKVISAEIVSGIGIEQFRREISIVARLNHPNILPLYDSGDAAGQPFFVMPRIRGGSLRARLERDVRLGLDEVIVLTRGITRALDHAHAERLLHCDVKPENVLLFDDHPYVMDFGIARTLRREIDDWRARSELDLSAGTPAYVSPEQAAGAADLDARSDVYSLACLTFEMLTGRPPFEGTNTQAVVSRRFIVPPPRVRDYAPEVPQNVQTVIERAMSLPREKRQGSAGEFAAELERASITRSRVFAAPSLALSRATRAVRSTRTHSTSSTRIGAKVIDLVQDVRLVVRSIRRAPSFAMIVILTLGLALGTNATMFGVVNQLVLRQPSHVVNPERIAKVKVARWLFDTLGKRSVSMSYPAFTDIRDRTTTLQHVAAVERAELSIGEGAEARPLAGELVTGAFFDMLGTTPYRGRFFGPDEDQLPSGRAVAVISHAFWRSHFGDVDAVGKAIRLNGSAFEIIGVAPPGFTGVSLDRCDVWVPFAAGMALFNPDVESWTQSRGSQFLETYVRLADNVSRAAASQDVQRAYSAGHEGFLKYEAKAVASLGAMISSRDADSGTAEPRVSKWLFAMALVVLLIACANLASLMMARGVVRQAEFAVQRALGISDGRLLRQLLVESAVIGALGVTFGLVLTRITGEALQRAFFPDQSWGSTVNGRVLMVTLVCAVVAALSAGLLPLWRSTRVELAQALRGASRAIAGSSKRALTTLLLVQTSLATALLVGAGLFVRSVSQVRSLDLGFSPATVMYVQPNLPSTQQHQASVFFGEAVRRIEALPEVEAAGAVVGAPFTMNFAARVRTPGVDSIPTQPGGGPYLFRMSPGAVSALQLKLLRGRLFTDADAQQQSAPPVIVTQHMAETLWPDKDPLSQCVMVGSLPCAPVAGVVANIHRQGIREDKFLALFSPFALNDTTVRPVAIVAQFRGDSRSAEVAIRRELSAMRSDLPYASIETFQDMIDPQARSWRLGATMFGIFGLLSLVIAAIGLYGVFSYNVNSRTRELGIRAALGASPARILASVLASGAFVAFAGIAIGLGFATAASRWTSALLFETSATDIRIFAFAAAVVLLTTVLAIAMPGRRAASIDPLVALRAE